MECVRQICCYASKKSEILGMAQSICNVLILDNPRFGDCCKYFTSGFIMIGDTQFEYCLFICVFSVHIFTVLQLCFNSNILNVRNITRYFHRIQVWIRYEWIGYVWPIMPDHQIRLECNLPCSLQQIHVWKYLWPCKI